MKYLPTDPETLTEIVTILAQAMPGPEDDDGADVAAVVAYLTAVRDTLAEEGLRRYRDLAGRGTHLDAEGVAELARLEVLVGTVDVAVDDTATGDPADLLGEHLLDNFARGAVRP